ncbi:hypothetical protein BU25DRAFT_464217 [Macroventuria anomochaeta]|uniref:Uncharacterized protein n=1 Tax=Macroventuria anomochaeta TaxID=301207 RepID=A0ACB6SG18_9PLEO|nr:uncharacterized protein BU25DRAFT_464217 [Macroventuria anomochaeta]KAF2633276.1 hypothetical protein BU25DRAFT_464217 [Macroventuria anomochaeta]
MGKPKDYAPILNGVMWPQVILACIFIALRIYTRHRIVQNLGWDDVVMVVNLGTFVAYVVTTSIATYYGLGKSTSDIALLGLNQSLAIMWEAICQGVCIMGITVSKASIALLLLRIVVKKWHVLVLWGTIISTTLFCCVTTILLFLQCKPAAFLWDHSIEGGYCWLTFTDIALAMGAWSAAMDFILAALPWHVVMALSIKRKEKITMACGLSLGVLAGACSVVRTVELKSLSSMDNYAYETAPMLLWSSSEVCLTIVCACIPTLRPLFLHVVRGGRDRPNEQSYTLNESPHQRSYTFNEYSKLGKENSTDDLDTLGNRVYSIKEILVDSEPVRGTQDLTAMMDNPPGYHQDEETMVVLTTCTHQDDVPWNGLLNGCR